MKETCDYYLFDPNYEQSKVPKCALIRGKMDRDGMQDAHTEKVIAWTTYAELGIEPLNEDNQTVSVMETIDNWIESEIGFVPEYELGFIED